MKKTLRTLMMGMMALLAGNALTSCSNDDELQTAPESKTGYVEFSLTRGADTRLEYALNEDNGLDVTWNKDDKVVVLYDNKSIIEVFELKDGEGTNTATFYKKNSQLVDKSGNVIVQYVPGYVSGTAPEDYILNLSKQEGTLDKLGNYDILTFEATLDNGKIGDAKFAALMAILHFPKDLDLGVSATSANLVLSGGYNAMGSESQKGNITIENVGLTGGKLSNDVYVSVPAYTSDAYPTMLKVSDKAFLLPEIPNPGKTYTFAESNLKEVNAEPLTLEPISADVTVTINNPVKLTIGYYIVNSDDEITLVSSGSTEEIRIGVGKGERLQLFGNNTTYSISTSTGWCTNIQCSADCYVYGNIMSLIDSENYYTKTELEDDFSFCRLFQNNTHIKNHTSKALKLPATTLADYCYAYMFRGCTGLTKAPELPATTLAGCCYQYMFYGCTGLTKAPELPAKTLTDCPRCYAGMFQDCTGLTQAPDLPATTLAEECYLNMFKGCTGLTKAPELPAEKMAQYCYESMFEGCISIKTAPALPATTLASDCYSYMFQGCTGLTTAPDLPATTLKSDCYSYMFQGCTGLTDAPMLPAPILVDYCYYSMFDGCTSLKAVTCLATKIDDVSDCITNWLNGVASSGTFTKDASMSSWSPGKNGIPSNWTIKNYGE